MGQKRKSIILVSSNLDSSSHICLSPQLRKKPLAKQCGQFKIQTIEWWFVRDCDVYLQSGYLYLVDGIRRVKRVVDLSPQQYMMFEQCYPRKSIHAFLPGTIFNWEVTILFPIDFLQFNYFAQLYKDFGFYNYVKSVHKWFIET